MNKVNPFSLSAYLGPDYFCNREKESIQLKDSLSNGRNITLFSPRRMGKTGLIHHFFHSIENKNAVPIYIDIFGTENLNDFINQLANASLNAITKEKTSFITRAMDLFGRIRPQINYDNFSGIPQISFSLQTEDEKRATLKEIFDLIERQKNPCIVAIDEFQQISQYPELNMEQILRTYIQSLKNVHFIFSGSMQHLLMPMFSDAKRPFYQSTGFLFLEKLKEEDYSVFISHHFNTNKQLISDQNIRFILEWSKSYTFYTQYLCNKIFSKRAAKISDDVIKECIHEIFSEREVVFYNYRKLLSHHQFRLLSAIATEDSVNEPTSQNFIKKHNLSNASTIRKSLKALIEKEMVYEIPGKEKSSYEVYDVFLTRWFQARYGQ